MLTTFHVLEKFLTFTALQGQRGSYEWLVAQYRVRSQSYGTCVHLQLDYAAQN